MSKLNTAERVFKTKFRTRTVVRPGIKTHHEMSRTINDYVVVPAIATRGSWTLMDMISDSSIRNTLKVYNSLRK